MAPYEEESEAVATCDPEDWTNPEEEVDSDPDVESPSNLEPSLVGELVSVSSSSDWEVVTFQESPFGVSVVTRLVVAEVSVPGGTYAGFCLVSESTII